MHMKSKIPNGYTIRSMSLADIPVLVNLMNEYSQKLIGADLTRVNQALMEYQDPVINLSTDTSLIFDSTGILVGYAEWYLMRSTHTHYWGWHIIHPEHEGKGLGEFLVDWITERGLKEIPQAAIGTRVSIRHGVIHSDTAVSNRLKKKGYQYVRSSYTMVVETSSPPGPIGFPEGISIRSMLPGEEKKVVVVRNEIFRDHWGYVEESFEDVYQRFKTIFLDNPEYDPRIFFLAMYGDEIVGISLCLLRAPSDASMGWVSTFGVQRDWRKMGLGLGLLKHSFDVFYQIGISRVGLGVDASNITGAVRLYEKAGMKIERQFDQFELELRPGKEIMVTGLE